MNHNTSNVVIIISHLGIYEDSYLKELHHYEHIFYSEIQNLHTLLIQ